MRSNIGTSMKNKQITLCNFQNSILWIIVFFTLSKSDTNWLSIFAPTTPDIFKQS